MGEDYNIYVDGQRVFSGIALLATPEEGLQRQGLMRTLGGGGQQGKHVIYMMAQRALLDFEESELDVQWVKSSAKIEIPLEPKALSLVRGAVLVMDRKNSIRLFLHEGLEIRPVLVAFHRAATRMIRLDVP